QCRWIGAAVRSADCPGPGHRLTSEVEERPSITEWTEKCPRPTRIRRAIMRIVRGATVALVAMMMLGCAVGPDYQRPVSMKPQDLASTGMVSSEGTTIRFSSEKPLD